MIAAILSLLAVILLLPAGFGYLSTSHFQRLIEAVNTSDELQLKIIKQDRGWLTSEVLLEVLISPSYQQSPESSARSISPYPPMYVRGTLHHGPFPIAGKMAAISPKIAHIVYQWVDAPGSNRAVDIFDYTLTSDLHFDGSQQVNLAIRPLDVPLALNDMQLNWRAMTANVSMNYDASELQIAANIPFLQMTTANNHLLIDSLNLVSELKKDVEGIPIGSSQLSMDRLLVSDYLSDLDFFVKNVNVDTESITRQATMDINTRIKMRNLGVADERFGKGEFNLVLRNLDTGVLARLAKKYYEISQQGPIPEQQARILMGTALLMETTNFLQSGPELELKVFRLDGEQDRLDGYAKFSVDNSQPSLLTNPVLLLKSLKAKVNFVIPESLLISYQTALLRLAHARAKLKTVSPQLRDLAMGQVKNSLTPFVSSNMLSYADNKYQLDVSLESGKLHVNGKPFNIPASAASLNN